MRRMVLPAVIVAVLVVGVSVGDAFTPPAGTQRGSLGCDGGYKPGTACDVAPPRLGPCPSDPTGCEQSYGTGVPENPEVEGLYPPALPGHPARLIYYNEGCKTSVPQKIWIAEGSTPTDASLPSVGVIPRTLVGRSGELDFTLPSDFSAGPYVSISAPATSGTCYPPFQGVWILVGGDACPTPALTATAHLDPGRREVMATIIARGLGAEDRCGRAELSVDHQRIGALRQTGSTATGTVRLTGSRSCISTLHAKVTQRDTTATHDAPVRGGKPTFQTATAVRTSSGTVKLLARVDNLRPPGLCGAPVIIATVAHGSRGVVQFKVLPSSATAATAHAILSGHEDCGTLLQFRVTQDHIDDEIPAPAVGGPPSSGCQINPP